LTINKYYYIYIHILNSLNSLAYENNMYFKKRSNSISLRDGVKITDH